MTVAPQEKKMHCICLVCVHLRFITDFLSISSNSDFGNSQWIPEMTFIHKIVWMMIVHEDMWKNDLLTLYSGDNFSPMASRHTADASVQVCPGTAICPLHPFQCHVLSIGMLPLLTVIHPRHRASYGIAEVKILSSEGRLNLQVF